MFQNAYSPEVPSVNIYIFNVESLILIKYVVVWCVCVSDKLKDKFDELWVRAYIVRVCVYFFFNLVCFLHGQ